MSMNMDMDRAPSTEYADHDVQVVTNQVTIDCQAAGNDEAELLDQLNPVSNRGIDTDEVAELVAMRRHVSAAYNAEAGVQTELNSVEVEADLGINLGQSEVPANANQESPTTSDRRLIKEPDNLVAARGANYDEPGALDSTKVIAGGSFNELADGTGGASDPGKVQESMINFRHQFGSGPYIDQTDDLTVFLEVEGFNTNGLAIGESTYELYWDVHEMPEGRASFASP